MAGSGMAHMRGGADVVLEARNMVVEFKAGGGRDRKSTRLNSSHRT